MLNYLKAEANMTKTENGAVTHRSTGSDCLDLFATIGALRKSTDREIIRRFSRAYNEDKDIALKLLFYARDIREGLGERRVFKVILGWLAEEEPASVLKNIKYVAEYGRYDDLLCLMGTPCEKSMLDVLKTQFEADMEALKNGGPVSLLAKWLPSVNASSAETVRCAKKIARCFGMKDVDYRKALVALRESIRIIENNIREMDYTFDYAKQPSKAMFKYRKAFIRNDAERYRLYINKVMSGEANLHTGTLMPYEIISPLFRNEITEDERKSINATWRSLEDFGGTENALAVIDGSGSMYCGSKCLPITVALSLGIYFAERNKGAFKNHFITFSENPQLVEIKGKDIVSKVRYCTKFEEVANTNLQRVFELILNTAKNNSLPQEELPKRLYIISDMEFDSCTRNASVTNFQYAKKLFAKYGYKLPEVVFWNVASLRSQQPVTQNEQGVTLVSGCTPRLFSMVAEGTPNPYTFMMEVLQSDRYSKISA